MTYNHPSMFITKVEYEKYLYNTTLNSLSDYQFVLEAFLYLDKPIVNYRLDSISGQISLFESLKKILKSENLLVLISLRMYLFFLDYQSQ